MRRPATDAALNGVTAIARTPVLPEIAPIRRFPPKGDDPLGKCSARLEANRKLLAAPMRFGRLANKAKVQPPFCGLFCGREAIPSLNLLMLFRYLEALAER
jgi:hypothetical protein